MHITTGLASFGGVVLTAWTAFTATGLGFEVTKVSPDEATRWTRWIIPLPKQVAVTGKARVPAGALSVVLPPDGQELERCAASELAAVFKARAEVDVAVGTQVGGDRLPIVLKRVEKAAFANRPNPDQAYAISTALQDGKRLDAVTLSAATPVGLYYASKTLQQLLAPAIQGKGSDAVVEMPVVTVTDWPDLEERGEWGGSASDDLEWMADRKFNLIERHATLSLDEQGVGQATMDAKLMERARTRAVRIVPIIHHLEQLERTGMFKRYPNLKATGVPNSICFAQPEAVKLLSEWLAALGRIEGVGDVMIWLSEEGQGCKCEPCQREDRFVSETRVCLAAWEKAKQACPNLGLRLLLTQASYKSNDKILAAVPDGVKVSYYHGSLTYDTSRREMIYPMLQDYVKRGRWLGVYPTMSSSWLSVGPFSNPYFVKRRLTEFVDKGLKCLVAYTVPANGYYPLNAEAAMEWSWNAHGRNEREFATAWAMRQGIRAPEKFAAWAETLSPVSWDVYGSGFPFREHYSGTDAIIRKGGAQFGSGIFFEFKREEQFDEDLAKCDAALKLAQEIGHEPTLLETRIVQAYVRILRSVWTLSKALRGKEGPKPEDRPLVKATFEQFQDSAGTVVELMPRWGEVVSPLGPTKPAQRFLDTVGVIDRLAGRVGELGEEYGVEDKDKAHRLHVIGTWDTPEFEQQPSQTRTLDVTKWVLGPGVYTVRFKYRQGTLGLTATSVALVSHPKDKPDDRREDAVDKHTCHAGAWNKDETYTLDLKQHDPQRTYLVVAQIRGGKTTKGEIFFRKKRPEAR